MTRRQAPFLASLRALSWRRVAGAGDPVEQAVGTVSLEVAPDLVELLAAVADDAAGLADIAELVGKLEQSELAPCYLLLRGHVVLRSRLDVLHNTILTPAGSGVATPGIATLGACGPSLRDTRCGANCQVNIVSVQPDKELLVAIPGRPIPKSSSFLSKDTKLTDQ